MSNQNTKQTKKSFCRMCTTYCAIEVDIEGGKAVAVRGDASDAINGGYSCVKGRALPYQAHSEQRLQTALKKQQDGSFVTIPVSQAMDEIAEKLQKIIAESSPRSVATFAGTGAYQNSASVPVVKAWQEGIGSISNYSTMTIDQPAKIVAIGRMGLWGAGSPTFSESDVSMSIGNNPIVSGLGMIGGPPCTNPSRRLQDAIKDGLTLICIDPRRTETAKLAKVHLQIKPGEDPALLSGIIRHIVFEGLHDTDFCLEHVDGLGELMQALEKFTLDYVAKRTDVPAEKIVEAAELFAKGKKGVATSGTGPDMAKHGCLTEHLISCLNMVCGRVNREGDKVANPGILSEELPRLAQAIAPDFLPEFFQVGKGPDSRIRSLKRVCGEMPAASLSDEILLEGEGQVKALISVGSNAAVSMPDQPKMIRALEALELSVVIDLEMSETAKLADYVLPAKHQLEREDISEFMDMFYEVPYGHYAESLISAPPEAREDWEYFVELAKRMETKLTLPGGDIDCANPPTKFELIRLVHPSTRVPLEDIRGKEGGHIFTEIDVNVDAPIPGMEYKLNFTPEGILDELDEVYAEYDEGREEEYRYQLVCRRSKHVNNSIGQSYPELRAKGQTNYAYMNPSDLSQLNVDSGGTIKVSSDLGEIRGIVKAADDIKPGVISMSHCWGAGVGRGEEVAEKGSNINRLIKTDKDYDPITGMPRMSAIPVNIEAEALK